MDEEFIKKCHLSNVMPDNVFHESTRQGITCSLFLFYKFLCMFVDPVATFYGSGGSAFLETKKEIESVLSQ